MAQHMKERLRMGWDMDLVNIQLTMQLMKESGLKVRNRGKVKLFSKAAVFFKVILKTIWNMGMERCITILLEIIFKVNGSQMWNVVWERWIGQILEKSMLEIGVIISNKDGEFIYGYNLKDKANLWEIDMKVTGKMESEMDLECFIMQMDLDIKVIGRIIWKKGTLFIQMKMVSFLLFFSVKIEW